MERAVSKLQTFINRSLRRILGIYWPGTISNVDQWETTGQARVRQEMTSRKWTWIGHILRRPNYCISRQALRWNPQGSRQRGDNARAVGEIQTTPSSREVFAGTSWNACPGQRGLEGLCQWSMFRDGIIKGFKSDHKHFYFETFI